MATVERSVVARAQAGGVDESDESIDPVPCQGSLHRFEFEPG
jgi:hypothetical protein